MHKVQNTSEIPVNQSSRRSFVKQLFVSGATAALLGCDNRHFPQEDQVNLDSTDKKDKYLIIKTVLSENLEIMYLYFRYSNKNFEMIDGIKTAKIQNGKDILIIQIWNGFLMWDNCLLIQWSINSMNVDIVYKDWIVKSRKRSMSYRELNDVILWANNNAIKS